MVLLSVSFLPFRIFQILDFPFPNQKFKKKERKPPRRARMSERSTLGRWHHVAGWYRDSGHWYSAWHPALMPVNSYTLRTSAIPALPPTCSVSSGKSNSQSWGPLFLLPTEFLTAKSSSKAQKSTQRAQRPMIKIASIPL